MNIDKSIIEKNLNARILRPTELAAILGVSTVTLWKWEKAGELPPRRKMTKSGKAVGWLSTDIEKWLDERPEASENDNN